MLAAMKQNETSPLDTQEEIDAAIYAGQIGERANYFKVRSFFNRYVVNDIFGRFSGSPFPSDHQLISIYHVLAVNYLKGIELSSGDVPKVNVSLRTSPWRGSDPVAESERVAFFDLEAYKYFLAGCQGIARGELEAIGKYFQAFQVGIDQGADIMQKVQTLIPYDNNISQEENDKKVQAAFQSQQKKLLTPDGKKEYVGAPHFLINLPGAGPISFGVQDVVPMYVKVEFTTENNSFSQYKKAQNTGVQWGLLHHDSFTGFLNSPAIKPFFIQLLSLYMDINETVYHESSMIDWKKKPWYGDGAVNLWDEGKFTDVSGQWANTLVADHEGIGLIKLSEAMNDPDFYNLSLKNDSTKITSAGTTGEACSSFIKKISFLLFKNEITTLLSNFMPILKEKGSKEKTSSPFDKYKYEETICYRVVKMGAGGEKQEWYVSKFSQFRCS